MGSKGGGKVDYTPMVQASDKAVALQSKIYEEQKQQAQPWLQAGQGALTSLQGRLGLTPGGTGDLMQTYSGQNLTDDPGYQFRLAQGQKAIERQQAAAGKYLTPEAQMALQRYGQDFGSQEYGNAYNRFNQDQNMLFNRLAAMSGVGQQQAAQQQQAGSQFGQSISNIYGQVGNAAVNAQAANQSNRGSLFNTLLGAGATIGGAYLMSPTAAAGGGSQMAFLSDRRLKTDIKEDGFENGHRMYTFRYVGQDKTYRGVMAQDILETNPDAVVTNDEGFYMVDYTKLGVDMTEVQHDGL